ncbi:hypothetical protein [Corynebacterium auriscanis]|uniref:hypothetical protein n=1 Tax=Corynebacterium auriscanis TaxID=99807 RepID=UPI003CF25FDD
MRRTKTSNNEATALNSPKRGRRRGRRVAWGSRRRRDNKDPESVGRFRRDEEPKLGDPEGRGGTLSKLRGPCAGGTSE